VQIFPTALAVSLAIFQQSSASRIVRSEPVLVRAVVNGNTIDVASVGHVRLLGIVAPSLGGRSKSGEPFATESRDRLAGVLVNRWIRLEHEAGEGKAAYVMTEDGVFINALMVREGLARVAGRSSLARFDELKNAEHDAQFARRGMWSGSAQIPSPSYTRKSAEVPKKKKQ
jgi:endonuclease YncB( thermonuclease family)